MKLLNSPLLNHHVEDSYLFHLLQMNRNLSLVLQLTKLETKVPRETEAIPAYSTAVFIHTTLSLATQILRYQ